MPFCRDLQAAELPVYDRRIKSYRRQHVGLQGLKRKCFPHAQSAETIRNRERIDRNESKNVVHKDAQFVPAILFPCNPVPLQLCTSATLHLTPYTLRFHFSTSPFSGFRSLQNCLQSSL